MIGKLLVGVALGFVGKKLYDEGKLDPYLNRAREKLDEFSKQDAPSDAPGKVKATNIPL